MRKSTDGKLVRRHLTFPEPITEQMAEVRKLTGAQSDSEVLRLAFKLYRVVLEKCGGEFTITDKDGKEKTIIVPE
mgnify:CR=1 FL=1